MFLRIYYFDFIPKSNQICQNLTTFAQISPQFGQSLINFAQI